MNSNGDADLDLDLGSTSYIPTSLNNSSQGAGVNAIGVVDMGFAASDPLSELVWSPHKGLRLKCANSGMGNKRPLLKLNMGPGTSKCLSISDSGQQKVGEVNKLTMFRTIINMDDKFRTKAALVSSSSMPGAKQYEVSEDMVEETCPIGAIHEVKNNNEDYDVCSPPHFEIADTTPDSSKANNTEHETHDCKVDIGLNGQFYGRTEMNASGSSNNAFDMTKFSEAHVVSPLNSRPPNEVILVQEELNKSKSSSPAHVLQNLEFSGENDFLGQNLISAERSPTNSRIFFNRDKGKEKVLSDGDIYGRSSNDSHESVESCNSASLFSKSSKRQSCDREMIVDGSKRMKKNGIYGSKSIFGPGSSFMSWISNMVKGLSDCNKQEYSSLALTVTGSNNGKDHQENLTVNEEAHNSAKINKGFRNMFQSMYFGNISISDTQTNGEDMKEVVITDKSSPEFIQPSFDRQIPETCKQIVVSDNEVNPSVSCPSYACESDFPEKSNHLASLWISRLYTTTKLEKCNQISGDSTAISMKYKNDDIVPWVTDSDVGKGISSRKLMASTFARRLDALKQVTPEDGRNSSTCKLSCFFCGRLGHDLRDCPRVTESELDDLLVKVCSLDRVKEFPFMCIRCLQLGHWAISCPAVLSNTHWQLEHNPSFSKSSTTKFLKLFSENVKSSREHKITTWKVKESGSYGPSASIAVQKSAAINLGNILVTGKSFPFCGVNAQDTVSQAEMFQAVKKLRLSRSDILRWMSSNVSVLQLNGLFLRLRLGKLEAGLGGSGYYVARITGVTRDIGRKTDKCILVDVGGMKSSVGSQYVSNQEFLEDEIDAWWGRVVKNGGKIPSLDELNLKFEDRSNLGF